MFYKINVDSNTSGRISISKTLNEKNKVSSITEEKKDIYSISAGVKSEIVEIVVDENITEDLIIISADVINKLSIPTDITYKVKFINNEICLGPVIGLLLKLNSRKLTEENIESYMNYVLLYKQFRGLLYVFAAKDIDFENNTVEGYYYYETEDGYGAMWKKSILPLASAVYRRIGVDSEIRDKLIKLTNNRFFNSYYFDKLEFYNIVSSVNSIKDNIPETQKLKSLKEIDDMFLRYNSLFLKPVNGSLGIGQKKITKEDGSYIIKGKFDDIPLKFNSRGEIENYIHKLAYNSSYLVQQGIDCVIYDERCSAIRVIMQKDDSMKWKYTTMIPYLGKKNGISSSYENYGYAMGSQDFFMKALELNSKKVYSMKMEIIEVCKRVCKAMDENGGNFGDVGIDVIVDKNLKIWILEVNKRHQHEFPLYIQDYQSFYSTKNNPIKYAVALCGFYE